MPFGDTTRSLSASAPQLAALLGERVLAAAALRDIGRERRENQDHCFAQVLRFPAEQRDLSLGLFVVADGMGGHHDGGYASKLALSTVVQNVLTEFVAPVLGDERPTPQPIVQAAVQAANAAVYSAGRDAGSDMGTTCTAALLYGEDLIVAHVGDSRALLIGSGVKQLTTDHTAVGRLIAIGALTPEEAQEHPLRNQLYRSIGQQPDVTVDVTTTTLRGETHLILCSDGLWGLVPDAMIADIVIDAPTPQVAARHLVAQANLLGGHDNISVVVVALPVLTGAHV
jgi:serine/threonine protein phosphatase PrpC